MTTAPAAWAGFHPTHRNLPGLHLRAQHVREPGLCFSFHPGLLALPARFACTRFQQRTARSRQQPRPSLAVGMTGQHTLVREFAFTRLLTTSSGCRGPDFSAPSDHGKSAGLAWRSSDVQEPPRSPRDWPPLCPGLWPLAPVPPHPQRSRGHCRRQTSRWGVCPTCG